MFLLNTRTLINNLGLALRILQGQQRQEKFSKEGFKLFPEADNEFKLDPDWPFPVLKWKAYADPRNFDELDFEISHITAVRGGYGVRKKQVKSWRDGLRAVGVDVLHPLLEEQLKKAGALEELSNPDVIDALAHRLALWQRYREGTPYHQIGASNGDSLANRPLSHVTFHGNWNHTTAGWALDVGSGETLEDWHVETGRASLTQLTKRILKVSAKARANGIRIAPHRGFSPSRRKDTGANVHREVIIPTVKSLDALEIDYHIHKGKGRPIPNTWDPSALYDEKGRPLQ